MTRQALRSRLAAAVINLRQENGQQPDSEAVLRLSALTMANELRIAGRWDDFAEKYQVVLSEGVFIGPDGVIR